MTATPLVVGVSGSRRDGSYTLKGVRRALSAAEAAGAETDLVDLGAVDLPLYNPDRSTADSGDAAALMERVRRADAVIVGSPVYHGSYSSTFRNFHDYCSFDEYEDTVVGILVVAGGGTIASTMDHMRITLRGVHADVIPGQVGIRNASDNFDDDGTVADPDIADRIDDVAEDVVAAARRRMAVSGSAAAGDD
ncbi:NADPH-dependent FMN reductase [Halobacterium jilantaiense]|uniref:NAD(P)H-dependent FMN reductase n=1 Tax=Halobacterium jilantaiense TaxID=355548 RepID=A0A1I0PUJ7_9EURY|nr:NADPH-dependent FMN reductase [Halobacterium jilantaiense]SEW18001.1 NAD(P)H-dependent FMN reductase [Halobacterium jilantaiense]